MTLSSHTESPGFVRTLSKGYALLILILAGLTPVFTTAYLYYFQDAALRFKQHGLHEIAIGISMLQSGFIAYVTYRCYLHNKEPFLRWLTLGFIGFTVIYGMHGVFTRFSHDHLMLFVLYGPASRLVMGACLLAGLMAYRWQAHSDLQARSPRFWLIWLGTFVVIDVIVYQLAFSPWASLSRWVMEITAMLIMISCALVILLRRTRSTLMMVYALSVIIFTQSSIAFLLGSAWDHIWWLAHAIFATGFMVISYGVIQAFLTTGSFTRVYSQAELLAQVQAEKVRADEALLKLQNAHQALEVLAATDSLTGCANRREFEALGVMEVTRSKRTGSPLSIVAIDLDNFKKINDNYGHKAGDEVLKAFVSLVKRTLRPIDLVGRIGGEEFALILLDTPLTGAMIVSERLRQLTEKEVITVSDARIRFTISAGIAQYGPDGETYESLIETADSRMCRAKQAGRNRVNAK